MLLMAMLALAISGEGSFKVRGRIQDYEKYKQALVVYRHNKSTQARQAIREAGFSERSHERDLGAYKIYWSGNDRKILKEKLERLAKSKDVQLIEPDLRR